MKLIEKYTQDDLPINELEQLTAQLIRAKFDEDTKQEYRDALENDFGVTRDEKTKGRRITLPILLAIAASFLILIYAIFALQSESLSAPQMADNYLVEHYPNSTLKGSSDMSQLRSDANAAYALKDFNESARLRKEILASPDAQVEDEFRLGLSLLYQKPPKLTEAIATFENILNDNNKVSDQEARWFLALALLKADRADEAKVYLDVIVTEGSWNAKEAEKILSFD